MKSSAVRESFLSFFERNGHRRVPSSPLLPAEDPTLLFTNAGMNQFKGVFTGEERRDYTRATSSQRCVRAGGKHNDLEQVGRTARHHTFFEMLGNFSFGDYFKEGAIVFAYDLLVKEWGLDPRRMMFTVFGGAEGIAADDEARALWRKVAGVGDDRVLGLGMKDNFWAMGDTGPCGPCSEIHVHLGDDIPCARAAEGRDCLGPACDCDRWNEIWNLVFMQYERFADGAMKPLPAPSIDTGMGLERVAAVIQGKRSNYDTDLFTALIAGTAELARVPYGEGGENDVSLRVIADHLRSSAFLVGDGVYPSNEGRGYVLRRIMRRMIRHARLLGVSEPFAFRLVPLLSELMADAHPVLADRREIITASIRREEETFLSTLDRGMNLLDAEIAGRKEKVLPGEIVFRLYDTYGFPPDLTALIARDRGFDVDDEGFRGEMEKQKERSRGASDFSAREGLAVATESPTDFTGYGELACDATVVEAVAAGEGRYALVLDRTPFYAESGGQVGDRGVIAGSGGRFLVEKTEKTPRGVFLHVGRPGEGDGLPAPGTVVRAEVDREARLATERNHTATHLLHAALRRVLGDHVQQSGSLVGPERLRFDFSHFQAMTPEEIAAVEREINRGVVSDLPLVVRILPIEEAKKLGAMAFFGDKYGELVRVVSVEGHPDYDALAPAQGEPVVASREFCGGCHVRRVGEIGPVKIVSESAIASGMRRIEAVTGTGAADFIGRRDAILARAGARLSAPAEEFPERIEKLMEEQKRQQKEIARLRSELAIEKSREGLANAETIGGIAVAALFIEDLDAATLRTVSERMVKSLGSGVVVLGSNPADESGQRKAVLCVQVSRDVTAKVKAGDLVGKLARICGGGGGGRPDMAQAGGKDATKVPEAISQVPGIVRELIG